MAGERPPRAKPAGVPTATGTAAISGSGSSGATAAIPTSAWCAVIGDVATVAECDRVNQIKANLAVGTGAFNAPAEMLRRQTVRLRLVIDRRAGSTAPAAAVAPLGGTTVEFATKVGRLMRAELGGEGFEVKPLTPAEQDLYAADQVQWEWQVTALAAGDRVLTLKTFVEIKGEDGTMRPVGEINTENRTIRVIVPAGQGWSDRIDSAIAWMGKGANLAKALAALLGALLAVWLAVKKFRTPPNPG